MTKKEKESANPASQKPTLAECDAMDEITLIDLSVVMGNIERPLSVGGEDSRFTAGPVWKEKLDSDDPELRGQIDGLTMRIPKLFDTVCIKLDLGLGLSTRIVVNDKGDAITMTCYDYPSDAHRTMMEEEIGNFINYDWVWIYEIPGREIGINGVYDKDGTYLTPTFSTGRGYCNPYHPSYTFILSALQDKHEGRMDAYEEKLTAIMSAPESYQPVAAVFEEPDYDTALQLATDSFLIEAIAIALQVAFTSHVMANASEYSATLDIKQDGETEKKTYSLRFDNEQSK